jgi:hypothetical protein
VRESAPITTPPSYSTAMIVVCTRGRSKRFQSCATRTCTRTATPRHVAKRRSAPLAPPGRKREGTQAHGYIAPAALQRGSSLLSSKQRNAVAELQFSVSPFPHPERRVLHVRAWPGKVALSRRHRAPRRPTPVTPVSNQHLSGLEIHSLNPQAVKAKRHGESLGCYRGMRWWRVVFRVRALIVCRGDGWFWVVAVRSDCVPEIPYGHGSLTPARKRSM